MFSFKHWPSHSRIKPLGLWGTAARTGSGASGSVFRGIEITQATWWHQKAEDENRVLVSFSLPGLTRSRTGAWAPCEVVGRHCTHSMLSMTALSGAFSPKKALYSASSFSDFELVSLLSQLCISSCWSRGVMRLSFKGMLGISCPWCFTGPVLSGYHTFSDAELTLGPGAVSLTPPPTFTSCS